MASKQCDAQSDPAVRFAHGTYVLTPGAIGAEAALNAALARLIDLSGDGCAPCSVKASEDGRMWIVDFADVRHVAVVLGRLPGERGTSRAVQDRARDALELDASELVPHTIYTNPK